MLRLTTLGDLALAAPSGESPVPPGHRRKLVLLAVLALADGPIERDTLVEMFWADDPDRRSARHSLSNALSFLRGILGRDAITMHRSALVIAPGVVSVDAAELLDAARTRNAARVMELHGGSFLDGISIGGSPALETWIVSMRERIRQALMTAAELRCIASAAALGWTECEETARIWLDANPASPAAAMYLLSAICAEDSADARRRALTEYDSLVARLDREQQATPDARVLEAGRRIQARVAADWSSRTAVRTDEPSMALPATSVPNAAPPAVEPAPLSVSPARRSFPMQHTIAVAAGIVVVATLALASWSWVRAASESARPVIAITDITSASGDSASAWLETGVAQMLATDLARYSSVEIIEPRRVRDVRARAQLPLTGSLPEQQAAELARRVGATLVVRGTLTAGGGGYALSLIERDVRTGKIVTSFNIVAPDPISLADQATSRLLDAGAADGARASRPRFAEVQTPSAEAYQHFVRGEQAGAEGRFAEQRRELDLAIALDSGFGSALLARMKAATPAEWPDVRPALIRSLAHARFTNWDMQQQAVDSALHNGEYQRSEGLAEGLVARYPHDPRAYETLDDVYATHGRFAEAADVLRRELALDSLGDEAGRGPCVPCTAYAELANLQAFDGQLADAEQTAMRWVNLQPDLPAAYSLLAGVLGSEGKFHAAIEAERRALVLGSTDPGYVGEMVRLLLEARRYAAADSLIATGLTNGASPELRETMADALALLQRERGELRASIRTLAAQPVAPVTLFERMDALSRLGDHRAAERLFHQQITPVDGPRTDAHALVGDDARAFAWSRSLEVEAIAGMGDSVKLHALADSIRDVSARSYYGRDWRLYHHVLGRIAMQGNRFAEAEREFAASQWGASGWTTNVAWQARAQLAQGRAPDAVATLRRAYEAPLDAMGRYEPRSELDFLMATAFKAAGARDSAATYRSYVAAAWRDADPELRRRLASLQ